MLICLFAHYIPHTLNATLVSPSNVEPPGWWFLLSGRKFVQVCPYHPLLNVPFVNYLSLCNQKPVYPSPFGQSICKFKFFKKKNDLFIEIFFLLVTRSRVAIMLRLCLNFGDFYPRYAYKRYAYKKN